VQAGAERHHRPAVRVGGRLASPETGPSGGVADIRNSTTHKMKSPDFFFYFSDKKLPTYLFW
jgi:hypothetical protein